MERANTSLGGGGASPLWAATAPHVKLGEVAVFFCT
jgi:hypothetical protein